MFDKFFSFNGLTNFMLKMIWGGSEISYYDFYWMESLYKCWLLWP